MFTSASRLLLQWCSRVLWFISRHTLAGSIRIVPCTIRSTQVQWLCLDSGMINTDTMRRHDRGQFWASCGVRENCVSETKTSVKIYLNYMQDYDIYQFRCMKLLFLPGYHTGTDDRVNFNIDDISTCPEVLEGEVYPPVNLDMSYLCVNLNRSSRLKGFISSQCINEFICLRVPGGHLGVCEVRFSLIVIQLYGLFTLLQLSWGRVLRASTKGDKILLSRFNRTIMEAYRIGVTICFIQLMAYILQRLLAYFHCCRKSGFIKEY